MYYKANDIKINIDELLQTNPREAIIKKLHLSETEVKNFNILKMSIDSRRHSSLGIFKVFTVEFNYPRYIKDKNVKLLNRTDEKPERTSLAQVRYDEKLPVIIGSGPCGLFLALRLLDYGIRSIIIERGSDIVKRSEDVKKFWDKAILDENSNVQFGLGGAGTFSDGKLMSRSKSEKTGYVLEKFVEFGAKKSILYDAKPHIGTDKLKNIVTNIKTHLIDSGVEFRFDTTMTDIVISEDKVRAVVLNEKEELACDTLFLCLGNSARTTFEMLHKKGVYIEAKSLAIGVRVEHPQAMINKYTYGKYIDHQELPPAPYAITFKDEITNKSVYSFCNCPGGVVINASSEKDGLCVNGMSFSRRSLENANSALVVNVPTDSTNTSPLALMRFQEELERKAFTLGGSNFTAPVMNISDLIGISLNEKTKPSVKPNYIYSDFNDILPETIITPLKNAIIEFNRRIDGFSSGVLTAIETRTSSAIRITRDNSLMSISTKGIYPLGEGSGYAGGITSSAIDGVKGADMFAKKFY